MKRIDIHTGRPYPIEIGAGLLKNVPEMLKKRCIGKRLAIVTDNCVDELYGVALMDDLVRQGFVVCKFVFPQGEKSKNLETVSLLYAFLSENLITRTDLIIALGGGVTGDLAGFAAASWLRGIDFIQIPTTLLAMVDSSVGGKTGVDIPQGKNLVGAFWQPIRVVCDPEVLRTLAPAQLADGMAEIIKYGAIMDEELFTQLESGDAHARLEEIICRCIELKRQVVERDERDKGERQWLNFGHTFGHAIERESQFAVSHGQGVAIGMVIMAEACERQGRTPVGTAARIAACCEAYSLPTTTAFPIDSLCRHCAGDKKRSGNSIVLVTLERLGKAELTTLPSGCLEAFMREMRGINRIIKAGMLCGEVAAPPSKSAAHRALICAALSGEAARVEPVADSEDMTATLGVLKGLGARFERIGDAIAFGGGVTAGADQTTLDCIESGSTLRFLLPVAAALGRRASFIGTGRLPQRPLEVLAEQMQKNGVVFSGDRIPFSISGQMQGGVFSLPGNVSSQFISGLLFALPLTAQGGEIRLTSPLQSAGYVQLTLDSLRSAGITVESLPDGWRIAGGQQYRGGSFTVEGDYSNAAFWMCAGAIGLSDGQRLTVTGLAPDSTQGDAAIIPILQRLGAEISREGTTVVVQHTNGCLHGCRIDASQIPDLIPALAVVAAYADGDTEFYNAARLRVKESDRIATTAALLNVLGVETQEYPDRLIVAGSGGVPLAGGSVDGAGDHRIVMAAAIAAIGCSSPISIWGIQAVAKSYPDFFQQYTALSERSEG